MQAGGAFFILGIINVHFLENLHDPQMTMISCIVETIESLRVFVIDEVAHGTLQQDLDDVVAINSERQYKIRNLSLKNDEIDHGKYLLSNWAGQHERRNVPVWEVEVKDFAAPRVLVVHDIHVDQVLRITVLNGE